MTFTGFRGRSDRRAEVRPPLNISAPQATGPAAFLGPGAQLTGKIRTKGTVWIEGRLTVEVKSDQTVIIARTGVVHATVDA